MASKNQFQTIVTKWFWILIKTLIFVVLPFLYGAVWLQHSSAIISDTVKTPITSSSNLSDSISYSFSISIINSTIPENLVSVFPLANYLNFPPLIRRGPDMMCFQDNGSFIDFQNGTKLTPDFTWTVEFNNERNLTVRPYSTNCTLVNAKQQFTYNWSAQIPISFLPADAGKNVTFTPETSSYPRYVVNYGILQGLASVSVAFLFIYYPAISIFRKIKGSYLD